MNEKIKSQSQYDNVFTSIPVFSIPVKAGFIFELRKKQIETAFDSSPKRLP
jgi:hypothetical protein